MAVQAPSPGVVRTLQALRGLAALTIVAYHLEGGINQYLPNTSALNLFRWGNAAVPVFFVLSGFVVALAAHRRPRPALEFLHGRLARLYPTYLVTAGLFIGSLALLPATVFRDPLPITAQGLLKTLFFEYGQISGYVYVGWVLWYEAWFYVIFSLVVARFQRLAHQSWFALLISAALVVTALSRASLVSYFLSGIATFLLCRNPAGRAPSAPTNLALLLGLIANGLATPIALIASALVGGLDRLENMMRQPMAEPFPWPAPLQACFRAVQRLGDASFAIYLVQVLTVSASLKLSLRLITSLLPDRSAASTYLAYWAVALSVGLISTTLAGLLMHRWIEVPCAHALLGMRHGRR